MKKQLVLLTTFLLATIHSNAQYIADCSKFCVSSVFIDANNSQALKITIFNGDTSITHINYPFVSAVIASNGDTIGNGSMEFFAHPANSNLTYTDSLKAALHSNFTGTVHLTYSTMNGGDTTCVLSYPCLINTIMEASQKRMTVSPNPASDILTVSNLKKEAPLELHDMTGKLIRKFNIKEGHTELMIDVSDLTNGVYLLGNGLSRKELLMIIR